MDRFLALRIFNAVVEEESLIGASRKLALSPSAVSKNLAALEEELGARLLNRTTRQVSLTEAGEAYFERTARLLADLDEADGMVSRMEGAPRGLLRVSAPISFGQRHLAPALPDFRAQHPEVVVQMMLEDRVVDLVGERFDLGIRIANLRDSSLVARKLASHHRKIYAAPSYIARRGLPVTPSDIEQHALVTMPPGSPLLDLPTIQLTPHLGASTDEAQEKAGVSVAKSVRLALDGELVPDAVNVAGGTIDPSVRPGIPLMEKLGQVWASLADHSFASIDVEVRGEIVAHDVGVLKLAALKGIFGRISSEQVSYVNAPLLAEQRGVEVRLITDEVSEEYRNLLTIRGSLADGTQLSVSGTLVGAKQVQKIVEINGYDVEVPMAEHFIVMLYTDRPGIVAVYGKEFGEAQINIAGMQIARHTAGGPALSVLTVDSQVPDDLLERLRGEIDASFLREITLYEV